MPTSKQTIAQIGISVLFIIFYVGMFSPFDVAEFAFVFALPFLGWASLQDKGRRYYLVCFIACWVAWFLVLIWLRHIHPPWGWLGLFLLSGILSLFASSWFCLAGGTLPKLMEKRGVLRILGMLALAGAWVLLEWLRTWIFTGFPWLPLAASQWQRPAILQVAAWTGSYGVSFLLIFFNLGLLGYCRRIYDNIVRKQSAERQLKLGNWLVQLCPEFYLGLILVLGVVVLFLVQIPEKGAEATSIKMGVVQPYIPATLKWEEDEARNNILVLEKYTRLAAALQPDLLLWPEAATPLPLTDGAGDYRMQEWIEALVRESEAPLLSGNLTIVGGGWYNGVFLFQPDSGRLDAYYAKRRLVPFGEYVPLRDFIPFVGKVVPLDSDIVAGSDPVTLPLTLNGETLSFGSLICYEDIFPQMGRTMVEAGADLLYVVTNDAWYGEEGGAYQHAAHSVLRAVETRTPVVRCGNSGWSGWINEWGSIVEVIQNDTGSIYFRGIGSMTVELNPIWREQTSFYVRWGDWFVLLCFCFLIAFWCCWKFQNS